MRPALHSRDVLAVAADGARRHVPAPFGAGVRTLIAGVFLGLVGMTVRCDGGPPKSDENPPDPAVRSSGVPRNLAILQEPSLAFAVRQAVPTVTMRHRKL